MTLFDSAAFEAHEAVHAFHDERTGLKAIIAVHSTARGPAAGGVRMWPYANSQAALDDVLRLSRAMSYKNAVADLDLGGGKSVILGDSRTAKSPALFEAFAEASSRSAGATGRRRTSGWARRTWPRRAARPVGSPAWRASRPPRAIPAR